MDIDIWVSGLEHHKKFKAVITNMNTMYTPLSLTFLKSYGLPITVSVYTVVVIMSVSTHVHIGASQLTRVSAISYSAVIIWLLER